MHHHHHFSVQSTPDALNPFLFPEGQSRIGSLSYLINEVGSCLPPKNHRPRQTELSQSEHDNLLQQRVLSRRTAHVSQKRLTIWSLWLWEHLAFLEQAGGPLIQYKQTNRICSVISSAAVQETPGAHTALPPWALLRSKNLSLKTWWQVSQSPACLGCKISHQSKTFIMSYEQSWPRLAYRYHPPMDCSGRVSTHYVFAERMNWTPRKTWKSMYKKQSGKLTATGEPS